MFTIIFRISQVQNVHKSLNVFWNYIYIIFINIANSRICVFDGIIKSIITFYHLLKYGINGFCILEELSLPQNKTPYMREHLNRNPWSWEACEKIIYLHIELLTHLSFTNYCRPPQALYESINNFIYLCSLEYGSKDLSKWNVYMEWSLWWKGEKYSPIYSSFLTMSIMKSMLTGP